MIRHLELKAYGKINLGLDVVRRREDGYHEVRMIMQTVRVYDAIELNRTEEEGIRLSTNLYYLPDNENNLGYRAAKLLMDEFGIRDGVEIKMKKFIPVAAGMAGGSSDAAAVLFGVNKMFGLGLSKQELMERGVRLGADVPYCIMRGTALSEGIGEILTPLPPMPQCRVLIAKPAVSVSTKHVYESLNLPSLGAEAHPDIDAMRAAIEKKDLSGVVSQLGNVLETVTIPENPVIQTLKDKMMEMGADGSLMSGSGVLKALQSIGADVVKFDPAEQPLSDLAGIDRAFLILHGKGGEDGVIQGVMEFLKIPYTGSGVQASAIGIDKEMTKAVWEAQGIPVPRGMVLRNETDCEEAHRRFNGNLVIKPSKEGSSLGLYKLKNATVDQVKEAFAKSQEAGMTVLAEEYVFGRELTVAVLDMGEGLKAFPIIEIKAPDGDYDFEHKYFSDETVYVCPAEVPENVTEKIKAVVEKAALAVGADAWSRIDVILRDDGSFVLLEINTAPGMTPHSLVPLAARTCGISYEELVKQVAARASLKG